MFPRKWFKYPCIATFALSDIECCLKSVGRIIGSAALDGTSLNKKPPVRTIAIIRGTINLMLSFYQERSYWIRNYLFLALSSVRIGRVSSSGSSSSCITGIISPIPKFWSHSLTFKKNELPVRKKKKKKGKLHCYSRKLLHKVLKITEHYDKSVTNRSITI